jgi:hypothetical protein
MTSGLHQLLRVDEAMMWDLAHGNGADLQSYPRYYCVHRSGNITVWPRLLDENKIDLYWAFHGEVYDEGVHLPLRQRVRALWRESKARKVLFKALPIRKRNAT